MLSARRGDGEAADVDGLASLVDKSLVRQSGERFWMLETIREFALARLREHGAQLVDEVVQYEGIYRLCYIRGPEGILIGLAEQIG